jgi:Fur family ferric uptake transcriptional regulator
MPNRLTKLAPKPFADDAAGRHAQMLRAAKLRVTPIRRAILRVMEDAKNALNAQEIFDRVASSEAAAVATSRPRDRADDADAAPDRVTVYRTLNSLVDSGIAHKVDPGDRVFRFSLTDHGACTDEHHVHEHPHFVCDSCGKVECLQDTEVVIHTKSRSHTHAGKDHAKPTREVKVDSVMLRGTCASCSK